MRTERLYLWFGRWSFGGGERGMDDWDVGIEGRSVLWVGFGGGFGVFGERFDKEVSNGGGKYGS